MNSQIILGTKNAHLATGLTVVIDVFRAFSTVCYAFQQGAEKIIPVASVNQALALKKQHPEYLLMGEEQGIVPDEFDLGNSPARLLSHDLTGKILVHSTTNGTKGLIGAVNAEEIITGSFCNAQAIVNYIQQQQPQVVSFLCTDAREQGVIGEDEWCARYLQNSLENQPNDFLQIVEYLRTQGLADKYFNPQITSHPEEDFYLCLDLDRFKFVLSVKKDENETICLNRVTV